MSSRRAALLAAILAAAALAGCGSTSTAPPTAHVADFPSATGKSLHQLVHGLPQGPTFAPSVSVFLVGQNRIGFGLFDVSRKLVENAEVALYSANLDGSELAGPYPATGESLSVKPPYQSQTVASDPQAAHGVYVANVPFQRRGKQLIIALVRTGGTLQVANLTPSGIAATVADVGVAAPPKGPPTVGQRAIVIHTPTLASVGGQVARIDTRVPPARALVQTDFANVVGRKPVVLLFATPALCQSRVCGPVVDIEDQVQAQYAGKGVVFIHQEIYKNNTVQDGFTAQVGAYRLPTEPWLFVIDRHGRISTRIEGAFSVAELTNAVKKVVSN